jgi:hypothetical protein
VHRLDCSGPGFGARGSFNDRCNELPGFIECWEFFDYLKNCRFLKKHSFSWSQLDE